MREILFIGKRVDSGEWIEGFVWRKLNSHKLENEYMDKAFMQSGVNIAAWHEVIPETVGQYTGIKDKNGNKIFEGDILELKTNHVRDLNPNGEEKVYTVKCWFDNEVSSFKFNDMTMGYRFLRENTGFKIIGNIHDNEDLLK